MPAGPWMRPPGWPAGPPATTSCGTLFFRNNMLRHEYGRCGQLYTVPAESILEHKKSLESHGHTGCRPVRFSSNPQGLVHARRRMFQQELLPLCLSAARAHTHHDTSSCGAGAGGRFHLPRPVHRSTKQHHWRSRFQYCIDRIPGDPDGSFVCAADCDAHYPHIGNTGTNAEDLESSQIYAAGLVIRDLPLRPSSWRMVEPLAEFLARGKIVAIAGIDTRRLTRHLREKGRPKRLHRHRREAR